MDALAQLGGVPEVRAPGGVEGCDQRQSRPFLEFVLPDPLIQLRDLLGRVFGEPVQGLGPLETGFAHLDEMGALAAQQFAVTPRQPPQVALVAVADPLRVVHDPQDTTVRAALFDLTTAVHDRGFGMVGVVVGDEAVREAGEEHRLPRIALPAGAAAELVVEPGAGETPHPDHQQPARVDGLG